MLSEVNLGEKGIVEIEGTTSKGYVIYRGRVAIALNENKVCRKQKKAGNADETHICKALKHWRDNSGFCHTGFLPTGLLPRRGLKAA